MPTINNQQKQNVLLTARDLHIMETIHAYDGMMNRKQIDELFFSGKGRSQVRTRLSALCRAGYLQSFNHLTLHDVPFGEVIYLLNRRGAKELAALNSQPFKLFPWRKKPRFAQIRHDLKVNDMRLIFCQTAQQDPELTLNEWIPEGEFLSRPDKISYRNGQNKERSRLMRPDGFFTIQKKHKNGVFAFLVEVDMGTEDNPRFGREKVRPGIAYLKSDAYKQRFGLSYGRWLVITTGGRRMNNMKSQTERIGGNGLFYFTTFEALTAEAVFRKPIWFWAGQDEPQAIL